jgi:hypothetical protein
VRLAPSEARTHKARWLMVQRDEGRRDAMLPNGDIAQLVDERFLVPLQDNSREHGEEVPVNVRGEQLPVKIMEVDGAKGQKEKGKDAKEKGQVFDDISLKEKQVESKGVNDVYLVSSESITKKETITEKRNVSKPNWKIGKDESKKPNIVLSSEKSNITKDDSKTRNLSLNASNKGNSTDHDLLLLSKPEAPIKNTDAKSKTTKDDAKNSNFALHLKKSNITKDDTKSQNSTLNASMEENSTEQALFSKSKASLLIKKSDVQSKATSEDSKNPLPSNSNITKDDSKTRNSTFTASKKENPTHHSNRKEKSSK